MGLDAVEIVMETEQKFGITILDEEAEEVETVGDLYELVLSKLDWDTIQEYQNEKKCRSQSLFYQLRQVLVKDLSIPYESITPKTEIEVIFPVKSRVANWKKLNNALNMNFPSLLSPKWVDKLLLIIIFLLSISGVVMLQNIFVQLLWFLLLMPLFLGMKWLSNWLFARKIGFETIGDLVKGILALNAEVLELESKQDIFLKLQGIIVRCVGVPIQEVVYEAKFIDDLQID